ncbi:hypothetical protein C4572_04065, partial [Candidatus Parcubacteria bacterium]
MPIGKAIKLRSLILAVLFVALIFLFPAINSQAFSLFSEGKDSEENFLSASFFAFKQNISSVGSFLKNFIFPADSETNPADNGDAPKKQNTADSSNSNNIYSYDKKELE